MEKRFLGENGPQVSVIGFGGGAVSGEGAGYGFGPISEQESIALIQESFEAGINLFDTAPIYGFGMSEERFGKALKKLRDKIILVSKGGVTWDQNKRVDINNSPLVIRKMLEESLRRLQTEMIDIYFIHWPDRRHDIRGAVEVLVRAQEKGQIKFIGLCNTNPEDLQKAQEIAHIQTIQSEFNLFNQTPFENVQSFLPKKGFMAWGTFDKGIITGRVTESRTFSPEDARSSAPWWKNSPKDKKMATMKKIFPELERQQYCGTELALSYNLSFINVSSTLCGIRNKEQLQNVIQSLAHPLPVDLLKRLTQDVARSMGDE